MDKRGGGGVSRFSVENFLSHSVEKFRRETLLCFTKFLGSKNVKDKRGGRYHDFPWKLFCLTVPNHFVEEAFCISASFGYRKFLCPAGEYHDFVYKICCLAVPENFVGEPFCVSQNIKFLVSETFMDNRGEYTDFSSKNFCLTVSIKFVGEPFSVSIISGIEKC